jgi:hypothetical protein
MLSIFKYMRRRIHVFLFKHLAILFITYSFILFIRFFLPDLEWYMASNGIVTDSELEEDPRARGVERKQVLKSTFHGYAVDSDDDL